MQSDPRSVVFSTGRDKDGGTICDVTSDDDFEGSVTGSILCHLIILSLLRFAPRCPRPAQNNKSQIPPIGIYRQAPDLHLNPSCTTAGLAHYRSIVLCLVMSKNRDHFLENDPLGKRLRSANYALDLLKSGELEHVRDFVFNARFDVRAVTNTTQFETAASSKAQPETLLQHSIPGAYVQVGLAEDHVHTTLFHTGEITSENADLYARTLAQVSALSYAALGLDMTSILSPTLCGVEPREDPQDS